MKVRHLWRTLTVLFLNLMVYRVDGTHFRGGLITWKPVNKNASAANVQVEFSFRFGWRRSFSYSTRCDKVDIQSRKLIGESGSLVCFQGCSVTIGSTQVHCTDFSTTEDWSIGERSLVYSFTSTGPFYIGYTGNAWIGNLRKGGGRWRLQTLVDLTVRSDTGLINSSPLSATAPIVTLQKECNHTIRIPVTDEDGDNIRCRWAKNNEECGGICYGFIGATLDERECTIDYFSSGQTGWYAVAIVIEDFASRHSTQPLSSVPLQFLVNVYTATTECASNPMFVGITRVDDSCVGVPPNSTFLEPIIAYSGGETFSITEIQTVSPQGFTKSNLAVWNAASKTWYVNVSYTPVKSAPGPEVFCYTAFSSTGSSSPQSCVTLLVGVAAPAIIEGENYPVGSIMPNHAQWRISYDIEFVRPTRRSFIRFQNSKGVEVLKIDTSTSVDVSYPTVGNTLQFTTRYLFQEKETYSVLMDPGVVKGVEYCGAESEAVRDTLYWKIRIKDITPPKLIFVNAPIVTLGFANISWILDEQVAIQTCTHQSPESTFTVQDCNNSWHGRKLKEGFHNLYIEATDLEGNISPSSRHSWTVDLTPPNVQIQSKPHPISNIQTFTFSFRCGEQCSFECAVTRQSDQPKTYYTCNSGTFKTDNLNDGETYTFYVLATDRVGNRALVKTYTWEIDITPPVIGQLSNQSVACGNNYDPSTTGYPTISDNRDSSPKLTYEDETSSSCSVKRRWILVDEAGNKAVKFQSIFFTSKQPPKITFSAETVVPCGSTSEISGNSGIFRQTISVIHPCNRKVNVTYQDSDVVNRCGFTFWRTWTVVDDCGEKNTAKQKITILPLQLPETPQNNEFNVDLNKVLRWPQYPGAQSYQVYIWNYGQLKPKSPTATENYRRYIPHKPYQAGSRIFWQIQYVIGADQLTPSPVWGFQTKSFPDLAVINVVIPAYAFSGSIFDVSWRVENKGNISTGNNVWYDAVYISRFPNRGQASFATRKLQRNFLDPDDWYLSTISIPLKETDLGNRYIFIETNIYRSVNEINHSNNIGTSAGAMYINLTPSPDLQVMEIVTPKSTFSGLSISIQWTVKNVGVGATRGNTWYDTAFWCTNTSIDDCSIRLVTVKRIDGLVPGAHYSVSSNIFVPNAIYGNYFILVQTDSKNSIYEHANEDNNVGVAKSSIHVTLTPPPDLVVVDLKLFEKLVYSTFEVIKLTYTVENKGSTAPFEPYWYDKVVIISAKTNKEVVISIFAVSIVLNPGHSYSRSATFSIPALFEHGTYTIAVRTDYRGNVFEFDAEDNNARSTNVVILQQLPDLIVSDLTFWLNENSEQLQIFVNWTVSNVGIANTLNFQWTDALYLQSVDGSFRFLLGERATRLSFKPGDNYTASGIFSIPSHVFGRMDLILVTNAIKQLDEKNTENNGFNLTIDIPMLVSDLMPTSLEFFSVGQIFPNSLIKLQWTVKNIGKRKVIKKWEDSLYLFNSETYGSKQTWLGKIERRMVLNPGGAYDVSAEVKIPENVYPGKHYIEVRVNNPETIYEAGQTSNNIAKINLVIQYPPAADLVITSVTYTSHYIKNVDRVLAVKWSGKNIGNSMQSKKTWKDKVAIFAKNIDDENFETQYSLGTFHVSASLRTNQDYSMYKIIPIPQFVEGEIILKITCDYDNTIREIGGESNNISPGEEKLNVGFPKRANLVYQFFKGFPKNATYSSSFNVVVKVRNVGEYLTPSSSWTDALFLYGHSSDTVDNIVARGIRLSTIHHNGELDVGGEYYINTSIRIPEISTRAYHVHVIVNLNDALRMKKRSSSNQSLIVNVGPLPDLTVRPIKSEDKAKRGGSPYKVRFNITNRGIIETNKAWFDAVYLSEDATLDPFDWRLGVAGRLLNLQPNETYTQTIDVFLPFDLPSREYYLIFNADSKDDVLETNNDNNQATQVINIQESPSTDLFVRHVETPSVTTLNSETTLKWDLGNNGSLKVSGYRCDATYFSKDSKIDFDDYELGEPTCGAFEIYPSGNSKNNDITETKNVRVPLVELGTFKTIIRTRSNTRDINPKNNIGVSVNNTFINVTTLSVDGVVLPTTLKPLEEKIFRIPEVLSQQTLIVTLKSDTKTDVNNLYLREKKPPSSSEFDARSAGDLSSNKLVTIPSTKALDYYLLVQNVGSLLQNHGNASNVQLFAKYAKFEVTSIFPTKAAPFGKTTVRIIGTLFPEYVEVFLSNKQNTSNILKPVKVYRFSSTEIYATFKFDGLELGTTFDLSLHDSYLESNKAIYSPSSGALQLFSGIPGQLSFNAKTSQALRPGESGFVNVHVYNKGDTDVLAKLMFLSIENLEARLNSGSVKSEYSSGIFFVPVSSKGPGGILPPKEYSDVLFEVKPDQNTREARIQIQTMGTSEEKEHIFIAEKELLKPFYYTDEQWEAVWKNFINLVGKTEKSLVNKLSDVSNYLSTVDRRIYDVNGLIKFLIDVADGTFLAGSEPLIVDDVDSRESLEREYSLLLRRKYSFALGPRYSNGVLGRGWILPWWDTSVNIITPSDIFFEWERQQFIFEVIKPGVYFNAFLGELYVNQTSNSLTFVRSRTSFEYKYNTSSKLLTSIKRTTDNAVITISYNEVNNLPEKFTTSLGDSMTVTYDNTGKLKSTYTSSGGHITLSNYEHEEQSGLLKSVTVNGLKTVYRYDENDFLSEIHYPDNSTVVNRYGTNKLLEKSSLFASSGLWIETLVFKRNGNGQIEVTKQPLGLVTTYKYDDRNHLAFAGRNFETPFKMRDEGFSRYVFHGDEVISKTLWNADMRRLTQINAKGNPMEVLYDELGNVKEYDMGDGAVYRANFNSIGKLSELVYPDMSTQKYEYDEHSKISKITTRDGNIKKYYFESSGNLIQKAVDRSEKTFSYNQEGNMVSATNEVGTIFFDYASKGFPKYVRYPNNFTLRYTYDSKGRRSSFSYNDKNNISYLYEPDFGKLSKVVHNRKKLLMEIKYNRNGKVSRKTLGNGMYTVYEYDSTEINLLKLTNYYANGTVTSHFGFSYDSRGRRILMNTTDGVWRYGYDSMSQLTFIKDPLGNVTRYTYDSRGNRLMEIKNNIRSYYTVNKLDQYVSHSKKSFSYDKNGNLVSISYPSKSTQVFEFDADNNLVLAKQGQQRCRYVYDALGNLYEKRCKDGTRTSFIVDPFGVWGSEIVGKIVNGKEIFFVYGIEHGLIAQLQPQTKEVMYYQFDPQGSVVSLMGRFEELINSYTYNTFGIVTRNTEKVENDFLFMGQWGVITSSELRNVCYMRARFYDAEEGRFMSIDPISFKGGSRNLYVYANSNPVSFVDPKGTIIPAILIGGGANVLVYLGTQAFLGEEITGAGIAGSLVAGSLGGLGSLGISTFIRTSGLKGIGAGVVSLTQHAKTGALSSFAGKLVEQILRGKGLDGKELGLSTLNGLIPIPLPPFGKGRVGQVLSSVVGSAASSGIGIALQKKMEKAKDRFNELKDKAKKYGKRILDNLTQWLRSFGPKALRRFNELKDKAKKYGKRILDDLIQWLRSFDPNDIIGPTGFGDSKFVRVNEKMLYKIRFENAENATAPAQRVLIKIKLDNDFDMRTFRLGSYGFGDYVADVEESKSFLQEKVRLIKPHDIYLRIQAGLDIVKGEASWTFQSIDPNTGFSPTDPRRGFLPPNNGTSGQGFVVFAINPKENLKTFTRIDAKAIIYFDKNEPIETPPIFNTIDAAYPVVTISLLNETSETGTPLFAFHKNDVGSGVRRVDIYVANASKSHEWAILMEDITENIAFIPLKQGISNEILVVGEDNVGNIDESGTNIQAIYIPEITNLCTSVNNCSGFGNCTGLNLCQCISGRYGAACNETTAPVEPPIIEFEPYYNISRSKTVPIFVNSRLVQPLNGTSLTIIFSNILEGFTFNKGHVDDKRKAVFDIKDLANLTLIPPPGYSGYFNLTVTALAIRGKRSASRSGVLFMYFQASESEPPTLKIKDICLNVTENEQKIPLINFVEVQSSSNETLYLLHIMQLPSDFKIIPKPMAEKDPDLLKLKNNTIKIPTESLQLANVYIPRVYDNFKTVNVSVNLVIRSSQEVVVARAAFSIVLCFTDKQDPDGKKSTNYLIMAISIAAGLLFLVLLVVLICCVKKKCKGNSPKTRGGTISMEVLSAK